MRSDEKAAIIASLEEMLREKDVVNIEADMKTIAMGLLALLREDAQRSLMARGLLTRLIRWGGR